MIVDNIEVTGEIYVTAEITLDEDMFDCDIHVNLHSDYQQFGTIMLNLSELVDNKVSDVGCDVEGAKILKEIFKKYILTMSSAIKKLDDVSGF